MNLELELNLNNIDYNHTIVVAVSTGIDSMTLLTLLAKKFKNMIVAHVNHQKRQESIEEENFIKSYCKERNIAYEIAYLPPNDQINFQAYARKFRYQFFFETCQKYAAKYLATAHHANDTCENVLMRLTKGTYLESLGSIKTYENANYTIIRPLSHISKASITAYANQFKVPYFNDESNNENQYYRNRIRNTVIPLLLQENPNFINAIQLFTNDIDDIFNLFKELTKHVIINDYIDVQEFNNLHIALKKYVLYHFIGPKVSNSFITMMITSLNHTTTNKQFIMQDLSIVLEYGYLYRRFRPNNDTISQVIITSEGVHNFANKYKIIISKNLNNSLTNLCYNSSELYFIVRTYKPGDAIALSYGHKKLSRLFIDNKIQKAKRLAIPVILDCHDQIIKVGNLCTASTYNNEYLIEILEE